MKHLYKKWKNQVAGVTFVLFYDNQYHYCTSNLKYKLSKDLVY